MKKGFKSIMVGPVVIAEIEKVKQSHLKMSGVKLSANSALMMILRMWKRQGGKLYG